MQKYLYSHFESQGHNGFLEHVSITRIDKTDGSGTKTNLLDAYA